MEYRIGLIGCGNIAGTWIKAVAEQADSRIEVAFDLDAGAAAARAAWLGETGFCGWSRGGAGWACAALESSANLSLVPPPRSMCFVPVRELSLVPLLLEPLGARLQGLAFVGPKTSGEKLREALEPLGLSRVAAPGRLQRPPVHWSHDGVRVLAAFC